MSQEIDKKTAQQIQNSGQTNLPEAGYKRTEEIAQRKDALAQQAEELAAKRQMFNIRKEAFNEEREIQAQIQRSSDSGTEDYFAGENLDWDHYGYRMVQCVFPRDTPGRMYMVAKSEGWEPVRGDEINLTNGQPIIKSSLYSGNPNFDNAVQIGDLVLMQMPRYQWEAWMRARDVVNQRTQEARRNSTVEARPGTIIHDSMDDPIVQRIVAQGGATTMAAVNTVAGQALAKQIGTDQHYENVRAGTVPGMQIGR